MGIQEYDENEMKTEEYQSDYDVLFYSKLDNLKKTVISLFEKYNLKYSTSKSIEFAISQCRDEYLSISAAQSHKISELEQYQMNAQNNINQQNLCIEDQIKEQRNKHEIEIKQIKIRQEKLVKKMIRKTKEETKDE